MLVPTMLDAINISVYVLLKGILAIWACVVFCKQFMQKGSIHPRYERIRPRIAKRIVRDCPFFPKHSPPLCPDPPQLRVVPHVGQLRKAS